MQRIIGAVGICAIGLSGCVSGPSTKGDKVDTAEASTIEYILPDTRAKIDVTLTLERCSSPEKPAVFSPQARAMVSVSPYAAPSAPNDELRFQLRGSDLESFWKKRDVKIDLYPHGALKTVNASSTDATASIIGGFIKLAGGIAGASGTIEPTKCNPETVKALVRYEATKDMLQKQRESMPSASDPKAVSERITALAEELARLETGELQIKLSTRVDFNKGGRYDASGKLSGIATGGIIEWRRGQFNKWFKSPGAGADGEIQMFSMAYCVRPSIAANNNSCTETEAKTFAGLKEVPIGDIACVDGDKRCPKTMVFRDPVPARLVVSALGTHFSDRGRSVAPDTKIGGADFNLAQWGELSYLDLSVGFGGSRSFAVALDEFGRKTQFGWTSSARGEGIVNGLNTVNDAYNTARASIDGENLNDMKARIDELETQQKLNKLENCAAILENGGFVCPAE